MHHFNLNPFKFIIAVIIVCKGRQSWFVKNLKTLTVFCFRVLREEEIPKYYCKASEDDYGQAKPYDEAPIKTIWNASSRTFG